MLLCGDWVVPVSSRPIPTGGVLVEGGAITAVGPAAGLKRTYPTAEVREFPGCALLPGLVNVHTHLEYSAFRGFAPACGFGEWMLRLLLARRKLTTDDYAASALWGAHECARSGVTTIADTSHGGWTVARAAGAAGLRARVYLEVFGLDDSRLPETIEGLEAGLDRLQRECATAQRGARGGLPAPAAAGGAHTGRAGGAALVEPGISPHAPYTVSARLYREIARLARRRGLRLATHVAESQAEVELLVRGTGAIAFAYKAAHLWNGQRWAPPGRRPMRYVADAGGLGPRVLAVHAVQVDADDLAALAASGAAVAHCPRSNLRLECGIAPVAAMMAAGITVGLGTDGLSSNEDLDMFAEMRTALQASRERALRDAPASRLHPATVLRMATLDGARALGWDRLIGSLEAGKRADVIAVRLQGAAPADPGSPDTDPTAMLVETGSADDVRMTMVDGLVVCEGGRVPAEVARGFSAARASLGLD